MRLTVFRALAHRNFALFASGQAFALVGWWMQQIAQSWLLYRLTGSATLLGVLGFASSVPILVLAPLAGLWSDRVNLHRAMFATQVLEMLQAITLAALAIAGIIAPWHIITLSMLMGVLVAIELPLRHAYLVELVGGKADLANAVAVTSFTVNAGRLVGPALAGIVIGAHGESACFAINALTYVAVLVSFMMIRVTPSPRPAAHPPVLTGLREGFAYAWHTQPIRLLLGVLVVLALLATPYMTLMPALVREVYGGGPDAMGFLVGAGGLGAIAGTLYLASRSNVRNLVGVIAAASFAAGAAVALLPWAGGMAVALVLLAIVGFGILVTSVSVNMILQTIVEDDKRGRVMSLYTAAFIGMTPFGAIMAGTAAEYAGVAATLTVGGIGCALAGLYVARNRARLRAQITRV
ncbi:MAG TPA: MFS transporter [Burkholderiales bacterium]|nr:MFS transporter [Burkholderiales bacterium]